MKKVEHSPNNHVVDLNIMNNLIETLENGKKCINLMRKNIVQRNPRVIKIEDQDKKNEDNANQVLLDHHSMVILESFVSCLDLLNKSCDFDGVPLGKRKHEHDFDDEYKFQEFDQQSSINARRECHKKSKKIKNSREEEVEHLIDDGFAWRKYGQKKIHESIYPRHYFRCTHKQDQNCLATKQIQQISNNPTKYKVIYHHNHSCNTNNIFMSSPFTIDSPEEQPPGIIVSFDGSSQVNPLLFPMLTFQDSSTTTLNSTPGSNAFVNRSILEDQTVINNGMFSSDDKFEGDYSFNMTDFSDYFPW